MDASFDISYPSDFNSHHNKSILITGAGFTKNFGGFLACELWQYIFNDPNAPDTIKSVMREKNGNYEEIFGFLDAEESKKYLDILKDQFELMDKNILKKNNFIQLKKFIDLFQDSGKYNFTFTTNQDLLLERYFLTNTKNRKRLPTESSNFDEIADDVPLNLPYLNYNLTDIARDTPNQCVQPSEQYPYSKFTRTIAFKKDKFPAKGIMNYVKLHGSFNWEHSEGYIINITGKNKNADIEQTNILKMGFNLLDKLVQSQVKFVLVGYGFNDRHVNDRLLNSAREKSSLIIISPKSWDEFRNHQILFSDNDLNNKSNSQIFFNSIEKYYECNFSEFVEQTDIIKEWKLDNIKQYLMKT